MTREEAMALCEMFPEDAYTRETGMGRCEESDGFIAGLKQRFPEFNWRVILDRSGHRSRWSLTIDDDDKREHYVPESQSPAFPSTCIHCGKTAKELGVEERKEYDRD